MSVSFRSAAIRLMVFLSFAIPVGSHAQEVESAFEVVWNGTTWVPIEVVVDSNQLPIRYTTRFMSEVCSDGLCRPVDICIDWDILGNFIDYRTPVGKPLTKFDHIEFTTADHEKLHEILADKTSLLQDYEAAELIDRNATVFSEKVDAVTGATSPTFEGAVVSGAVYTVHTLWRFVNGEAATRIRELTCRSMDAALIGMMLRSGYTPYIHFALKHLEEHRLNDQFADELLALVSFADDYVPHIAVRQLPGPLWHECALQMRVMDMLDKVDMTVQNTVLNKFSTVALCNRALAILLDIVPSLGDRQVELAFSVMDGIYMQFDNRNKTALMGLLDHPREAVAKGAAALEKKVN